MDRCPVQFYGPYFLCNQSVESLPVHQILGPVVFIEDQISLIALPLFALIPHSPYQGLIKYQDSPKYRYM